MTRVLDLRLQALHASASKAERATRRWSWLGVIAPVLAIALLVGFGLSTFEPRHGLVGQDAPRFTLPTSTGSAIALDEILGRGNDVMLYFSMGIGCDQCFIQISEIDDALTARGITLVPVMVDSATDVALASTRLSIAEPILIDEDRSVSTAYEMLGFHGHDDRPSHSFALVDQKRRITWIRHYATMFVPMSDFINDVGL